MKNISFLFTILIWFSSCGSNNSENHKSPVEIVKKDSITVTKVLGKKILGDTIHVDFNLFWKSFRKAIIEGDTQKVMVLTKFPLETQGPYDADPIIKFERKKFPQLLSAYLKEEDCLPGENKPTSFLDQIKKTQTLEYETVHENWARIGNFEFRKIRNRWQLTFAYLSPTSIEELRK